jgi:hypothetical protein
VRDRDFCELLQALRIVAAWCRLAWLQDNTAAAQLPISQPLHQPAVWPSGSVYDPPLSTYELIACEREGVQNTSRTRFGDATRTSVHLVLSLSRHPQHPTAVCRRSRNPGAPDIGSRNQHRRCSALCHILRHFASGMSRSSKKGDRRKTEGRPERHSWHAQVAAVGEGFQPSVGGLGGRASRAPPAADLAC